MQQQYWSFMREELFDSMTLVILVQIFIRYDRIEQCDCNITCIDSHLNVIFHHHCSAQWSFSLRQNLENSATVGDCCFQLRVWHQNCLVSELLVLNSLEVDLNIILGSTDCSLQTSHRHLTHNNLKTASVGNNRFRNDHLAISSFWYIVLSCSSL